MSRYHLTPAEVAAPEKQLELLSMSKFENPFVTSYCDIVLRTLHGMYGVGKEQAKEYFEGLKKGYWNHWPQGNLAIPPFHCHPMLMSGALFTAAANLHYSAKQPPWGVEAKLPSLLRRPETEFCWYDAAHIWASAKMYSVFVGNEMLAALGATTLEITDVAEIRWPRHGVLLSFPVGALQLDHPMGISVTQILAVRTHKQDHPQFSLPGIISNMQAHEGFVTISTGITADGMPVLLTTDIVGINILPDTQYEFQLIDNLLLPKVPTIGLSQFVLNLTVRVLACMSVNPEHLAPFSTDSMLIEPTSSFGFQYKVRGLQNERVWNWGKLTLHNWREPYLFAD